MTLKKIMLVDDSETDLFINKRYIEMQSVAASIVCKQSGKSALEYLMAAPEEGMPDFILLDVKMPDMDGFSFLEKFCGSAFSINGRTKVIMVTSSDSAEDQTKAKKFEGCGVIDYLIKPLSLEKAKYIGDVLRS